MNDAGIYIIQRKDSDDCYVGSAVNVARRWADHKRGLRNGKHSSRHMQNVHDKHGIGAFEFAILEHVADKAKLIEREQAWLDAFRPAYNTATVAGSLLGFKPSDETRARMSASMKARPPFSAEHRANISAAAKSRPPRSDEYRAKMSEAQTGKKHSPETIAKMTGRKLPPETIAKISAAGKGRKRSPETCANISAALKGHTVSAETRANQSAAQKARCARERIHRSLAA